MRRMRRRAGGRKVGRNGEKYWDSEVAATEPPHGRIYCQIFSTRIWTKRPLATNKRTERGGKRGKLEKTAEGVNNSCRQYDFFM